MAVAVYNHRRNVGARVDDVELHKSNIVMLGPTGSGKHCWLNAGSNLKCTVSIADAAR